MGMVSVDQEMQSLVLQREWVPGVGASECADPSGPVAVWCPRMCEESVGSQKENHPEGTGERISKVNVRSETAAVSNQTKCEKIIIYRKWEHGDLRIWLQK